MKFTRALLLSILITLVLTFLLRLLFGVTAYGLFLFLPISFYFTRNRYRRGQTGQRRDETRGPDSTPIEPK